mgnify:CR=1 FL=1
MEYIKPGEFLKQPEKVQEVFRKWWKPEMYDLFFRNFGNNPNNFLRGTYIGCIQDNETKINATKDKTWLPILTEGQLRKFIEDKTASFISTKYNFDGYTVYTTDELTIESDDINFKKEFNTIETNLLLAYWYVACQIAEEG